MSNYYLILVWIAVCAFFGTYTKTKRTEVVRGERVQRVQPIWAIIFVAPLVLWAADRGWVGDSLLSS